MSHTAFFDAGVFNAFCSEISRFAMVFMFAFVDRWVRGVGGGGGGGLEFFFCLVTQVSFYLLRGFFTCIDFYYPWPR